MTKPVYSIREFCDDHSISRSALHILLKEGRGPRVMQVGRRVFITQEAAAEWRARMESNTAAADAIRQKRMKMTGRKVAVGSDGKLVIVDPAESETGS